jgi:hypothetical protein
VWPVVAWAEERALGEELLRVLDAQGFLDFTSHLREAQVCSMSPALHAAGGLLGHEIAYIHIAAALRPIKKGLTSTSPPPLPFPHAPSPAARGMGQQVWRAAVGAAASAGAVPGLPGGRQCPPHSDGCAPSVDRGAPRSRAAAGRRRKVQCARMCASHVATCTHIRPSACCT